MTNAKNLVLAAAAAGGMFLILKNYAARPKASTAFLNPQAFSLNSSIGVFGGAGVTQEQAAANATADYNNQFISPWTTGYGVMR